jgi:DNA-binding LacI/PurR family transcriptional regulator
LIALIDRKFDGLKTNYVGTNDHEVGAIATEYLIENGCRQMAHIAGQGVSPAVDRLAGYRDPLARTGCLSLIAIFRPERTVMNRVT